MSRWPPYKIVFLNNTLIMCDIEYVFLDTKLMLYCSFKSIIYISIMHYMVFCRPF
jgi:hypothetical protein